MPTRRILLLADDSPTIQKVVSLTFEDEGLQVVAVGSGGEALTHLESNAPDIILADVHMPAPGGYELCARVKRDERLRGVPVMLLVGAFEPYDEAEARKSGADGVLTKPFQSIRELVSKVGVLLGGHPEPKASEDGGPGVEVARTEPFADAWHEAKLTPAVEAPADAPAPPNFDLDDESIETVPADNYAARAAAAEAEEHNVEAFAFAREEDAAGGESPSHVPSGFGESVARHHEARQESHNFAAASSGFGAHASAAPAGFEPRPASPPAEDSLLDLDDIEAAPADDPDDFILDFDDEPASFVRHDPAAISPANLSSAWQDFNLSALPADADAPTMPGIDSAAMDFETVEAPPAVGHSDSEGAPAAFDTTAAPSDFEIVNPPVVGDRVEAARVEAAEESSEPVAEAAGFAAHEPAQTAGMELSPETIDAIARRVVEQMSERVLREIAWEVVPDLAERLIRQRLEEEKSRAQ